MDGHHDTGPSEALGVAALGGGFGVLGAWTAAIHNRKLGWRELVFGCGLSGFIAGGAIALIASEYYPKDYKITILFGIIGGLISSFIIAALLKIAGFGENKVVTVVTERIEMEIERRGFQKRKTDGRSNAAAGSDGKSGGSVAASELE